MCAAYWFPPYHCHDFYTHAPTCVSPAKTPRFEIIRHFICNNISDCAYMTHLSMNYFSERMKDQDGQTNREPFHTRSKMNKNDLVLFLAVFFGIICSKSTEWNKPYQTTSTYCSNSLLNILYCTYLIVSLYPSFSLYNIPSPSGSCLWPSWVDWCKNNTFVSGQGPRGSH